MASIRTQIIKVRIDMLEEVINSIINQERIESCKRFRVTIDRDRLDMSSNASMKY